MKRIMLTVAYDGTAYHGWQKSIYADTVSERIERAIFELTGQSAELSGASRTDAGVHALGNLAVFDISSSIPPENFCRALNSHLPSDIRIISSRQVADDFHPRFAKTEKTYRYIIYNSDVPNPIRRLYTAPFGIRLDEKKMNEAALCLVGEHDFTSFCSVKAEVRTKVREITYIEVCREGVEVIITVKGYGFLYNMVRIIAGTLIEVGRGKYPPEYVKEILAMKKRALAGPTAPPCGLTLVGIEILE